MAHNIDATPGTGATLSAVDLALSTYPSTGLVAVSVIYVSADATTAPTPVTAANALYVRPGTSAAFPVTDNSGSLTVDAPVGTPVFVRLSDGSSAITTLPVSLASVPSHAVTNAGTFAVQAAQSGTWTVDLGATDNAVLDAIAASLAGTLTVGSHAVTNAGTFAVQESGAALTALQLIDDAIATTGSAITAKGMAAVGTDGTNARILKTDSSGELQVDVLSMPTTTVTGTVAVTQSGTWDEVGINDSGNSITVDNNGTFAVQAVCTNAGTFAVQAACTNAGTFVVQENGAALTALQLIDDGVFTDDTSTHSTGSSKGYGIMAVATPSDGSVNANDFGHVAMTTDRKMHVAVMDALPAGTNNLGLIDIAYIAAGTNNIGDVDVVSVVPGTGATNLGKAEDAVHSSGDTGVMALVVRQDSHSDLGADGDYVPMTVDADGGLRVSIVAGAGSGGTAAADDADFSAGSTSGTPAMGVYESSPTSVTDGDLGTVGITQTRALKVQAQANSGVDIGDVTINNATIAVTQSGTWDEVGINDSGNSITVDNGGTFVVQVDGTALTRLTDIETNTDSGAVVGNGAAATAQRVTLANDSTGILATVTTVTTLTTLTGGGVAHDSGDSGNPVKVGARAAATLSDDTMVANADRTDMVSDLDGALIVRNTFPLGDLISERVSNTDGASTAFSNFGATASTRNVITAFHVFRTDAGTSPIYVDFRDGTAGSILWTAVIPAGGGANSPDYQGPGLFRTTANTALAYDVSAATTTVYISITGYKSKV